MNTTNPDGDGKREAEQREMEDFKMKCQRCNGYGWDWNDGATAKCRCEACSGTGLAPQFLVQHPDFKREQ